MSFLSYTREFNDNLLMLLLRDHERYMPIVECFDTLTRKLSELSWAEAELIATEISKDNQSGFCAGIRGGMTVALKADADALDGDRLHAALSFALKVNRAPGTVTGQDISRVLQAGWSEQTVEDLVGLVAIQTLYNTLATGLGFQALPAAAFEEIGRHTVGQGGYVAAMRSFMEAPAP